MSKPEGGTEPPLQYSFLDEPLIRYRRVSNGVTERVGLPELFVAMAADEVRDFPALRPHQRHPWHAFLVQLAAIALHNGDRTEPWGTADGWRNALLALTPADPDGAAWCLVTPPDRPALLQAPVPGGDTNSWKSVSNSADELDMLVTSKNHDLKSSRIRRAEAEDWFFALLSLQTQEGFLGAGNYGISRMNGGFASRPGVGVAPVGNWGERWRRDVMVLLQQREHIAEERGLASLGGHALLWLLPWGGADSLAFTKLDPNYIEICRRVRIKTCRAGLIAISTGTKAARVMAKDLNGVTGDPWTPIDISAGKALTITGDGFGYKLMSEILTGSKYSGGAAQSLTDWSDAARLQLIAQGTARGQGKTEGYHERRIPISPKVRKLLLGPQRALVADIARHRIAAIADVRKLLWSALLALFSNGESSSASDGTKDKASDFAKPFERAEDARFFADLTDEIEAADPHAQRITWLIGLTNRAEALLRSAFEVGPRSGMQRYKARAAALTRFHSALRGSKPVLPDLANHYRQQSHRKEEETDVPKRHASV